MTNLNSPRMQTVKLNIEALSIKKQLSERGDPLSLKAIELIETLERYVNYTDEGEAIYR